LIRTEIAVAETGESPRACENWMRFRSQVTDLLQLLVFNVA